MAYSHLILSLEKTFYSLPDGSVPNGSLVQGIDGDFYGMCYQGGNGVYGRPNSFGTIFKISSSGAFTKLRDLTTIDGTNPRGNLIQATDGDFYGMCSQGGMNGYGTIFKIGSNGSL